MFSTDFIFRQQENLVDNQKCKAGFRPLCNKILFLWYKILQKVDFFDHLPPTLVNVVCERPLRSKINTNANHQTQILNHIF